MFGRLQSRHLPLLATRQQQLTAQVWRRTAPTASPTHISAALLPSAMSSKRGPLDAFFKPLHTNNSNKKAKQGQGDTSPLKRQLDVVARQSLHDDQQASHPQAGQEQQQPPATQGQGRRDTAEANPGPSAAAAGQAAATAGASGGSNAFGALMAAAAQNKRGAAKGSSSSVKRLSTEEMLQLADRNQAAVAAALQAAAASKQQPQLSSLLVEPSWLQVLGPEFEQPYMQQLQGFLQQEWANQVIYPPQDSIFRAFNAVPFDQVRVVILGQDPYINQGEAMGLSFSVPKGIKVPPSLANIYKELAQDVGAQVPKHGCLTKWCGQGVLLLNAALTVRAKSSNSHAGKGWEAFTTAALTALAKQRSGIVFLLWGNYAQNRCAKLDMKKHHVLKSVHPSPLSAHRGFLGCGHFSAANKLLVQSGQPPIDWQIEDA